MISARRAQPYRDPTIRSPPPEVNPRLPDSPSGRISSSTAMNNGVDPTATCAICGRTIDRNDPARRQSPFCSKRCQQVDLGRWLTEAYTIDRDLTPEDLGDSDSHHGPARG
ncbi:MAG: DNA gyrase inhibitor YacG [Phycisphaerae bacterium]|nr:DNA gyrase inhibitor YacG [Phycisphaerae bacterium]